MSRILLSLFFALAFSAVHAQQGMSIPPSSYTDAQAAAAAPVQSVNTKTGAVTLPTYAMQIGSGAPNTSTGIVTWTYPTPFTNTPSCQAGISAAATGYVYSAPVQNSVSTTAVSFTVFASPKVLTIALGSLTVWIGPPTGTTVTITCIAPI